VVNPDRFSQSVENLGWYVRPHLGDISYVSEMTLVGHDSEFHIVGRLVSRKKEVSAQWLSLVRWTSEDLYTAKIISAGFKPTSRETDFDSVVVTTQLRPVRWSSEETIHESMSFEGMFR
jgi:hypothetical protein